MLFWKEKKDKDFTSYQRDEAISKLESERARVNAEIENILLKLRRESGLRQIKPRRRKIGKNINDYNYKVK